MAAEEMERMTFEDRLRAYVEHVGDGGDPYAPEHPLGSSDHEVWVSWRTEPDGDTRLSIQVDDGEQGYLVAYGPFVGGEPTEPSWEGGINGPDVPEWDAVRRL